MSRFVRLAALLAIASFAFVPACGGNDSPEGTSGGEDGPSDGGRRDGGPRDGGVRDGSVRDAGLRDAGIRDAGPRDASASSLDAGPRDAGGIHFDAGGSSPWGASRDEQCARPPRPAMSAAAAQAFATGVQLTQTGDLAGASAQFSRALQTDRQAYLAAYDLGVVADRQSRESEAMDYYRQALRIVPSYEDAIEAIVLIHLRRGRNQDALTFVQPLATQFDWSDRIHATTSRVLAAMSRWDESMREARRGLVCDERSIVALTAFASAANGQGNLELANWVLDRIAQVEATDTANPLYAESHLLRGQIARNRPGELERALAEFDKAVQLRPDYVDARMALGQLMLSSGAYPDALRHLESAAQTAPWSWQVQLAYADALRAVRRYDDAKRAIDRVMVLSPNQPEGHLSLGLMYMEQANCLRTGETSAIPVCTRALNEISQYRTGMGSRLPTSDRSSEYVQTLTRILSRLNAAQQAAQQEQQSGSGATEAP